MGETVSFSRGPRSFTREKEYDIGIGGGGTRQNAANS